MFAVSGFSYVRDYIFFVTHESKLNIGSIFDSQNKTFEDSKWSGKLYQAFSLLFADIL